MGLGAESLNGWSVGSRMRHDDNAFREGDNYTEPAECRKLRTRDLIFSETTCLENLKSQFQITTDSSEWKLTASILNWWVLLSEGFTPSLSSAYQRVKSEMLAIATVAHPHRGRHLIAR